jgi:hypothetical protein
MTQPTAKNVRQKFEILYRKKEPVMNRWQEVAELLMPSRELYLKNLKSPEQTRRTLNGYNVYDGNPLNYMKTMVDGMYGNMCAKNIDWVKVASLEPSNMKKKDVRQWSELATQKMYNKYSLSNFYDQIVKYLSDGIGLGTATMWTGEDNRNSNYHYLTRHPAEIFLDVNEYGDVDTVFRYFWMSALNAVNTFPKNRLSRAIQESVKSDDPFKLYPFIHACIPTDKSKNWIQMYLNQPWTSYYAMANSDEGAEDGILDVAGYYTFPYSVWRYRVDSADIYGRSPGEDAYYDIEGINEMGRSMLQAGQMAADPPINAPTEAEGEIHNYPHGVTYYEDPGRLVTPFNTGINYPVGVDQYDRKLSILQRHFLVDFFNMLNQITGRMTAYEVAERMSEKIAVVSATIGQFESEGLDGINERTLDMLIRNGEIPPPPPAMLEDGALKFDYQGPLAMAMKRLSQGQGMARAMEQVMPIFQAKPDTMDRIDLELYVAKTFELNGAPEDLIKSDREVERERAERQQLMEAQMAAENAEKMGKALPGLNQQVQPGTPAAAIMGQ